MRKTVLRFGAMSGGVSAAMMLGTVPFIDKLGASWGVLFGYTAIVLSFLFVFFGLRSYREQNGGTLSFSRGFVVGLQISLISSLCYVATWELLYFKMPGFADRFAAVMMDHARSSAGEDRAQAEIKAQEMQQFMAAYQNPLTNAAFTFIEPFPVGLGVTLLSAAALRRRRA